MKIPRLSHWDAFYIFEEGTWRQLSPEEVVAQFNNLADRYEVVLTDIEEILVGYPSRTSSKVRPGIASTA